MPKEITITEARRDLAKADRVLVLGCSGGGKTTLSMRLAEKYAMDYQSLDRDVRWLPGWKVRDQGEQRERIKALSAVDRWVMDGNSFSTFDLRLPRTDLVIWVRLPRWRCLWGVAKRVLRNFGRVRTGMAEGCPEPLPDREFLSYIWNFEKRQTPRILEGIERHGPEVPVLVLRSHRMVEDLLSV